MFKEFYSAIDNIQENLKKDLIGPIENDGILFDDRPLDRYTCGILWPQQKGNIRLTIEDTDVVDEEFDEDIKESKVKVNDSIFQSNKYKPSAMAITVMVKDSAKVIEGSFEYAKYICTKMEEKTPAKNEDEEERIYTKDWFKRCPFKEGFLIQISDKIGVSYENQYEDFKVQCTIRKVFNNGNKLITVSIVNSNLSNQKLIEQNEKSLFQCVLSMESKDNGFIPIYKESQSYSDEEDKINNMLYAHVFNYAYGHGCSVEYDDSQGVVKQIKSSFIPFKEVFQMKAGSIKNDEVLKMNYYKLNSKEISIEKLNVFLQEYKDWYQTQLKKNSEIDSHEEAIRISLSKIDICIKRIANGISKLGEDKVFEAFVYMNESMCLQRIKSKGNVQEDSVKWYPFQLAYILQIIPDIIDGENEYRKSVDLLWFPTGGGKTEAYLGVAAFTIFYRRITHDFSEDGVAVLMRYTLRLLTIQQFERATALICSCEYLRKKYNIAGGEINIGLWIGSGMTPNSIEKAKEVIQLLKDGDNKSHIDTNPVQVETCPWCKSEINVFDYSFNKTMKIKCPNNNCEYHEGLPIYLIDEDIYKVRPTLILSTVDKFARIVWEADSKSIFGNKDEPSIDLIIQDELHLISGPLGSIAGVYELAVAKLCERNGVGAKVIASTATVRNASQQIKNLYNKNSIQFPPNGLNVNDSFFAVSADRDERPARRYLGVSDTGGSLAELLVKVYANLTYTKLMFMKIGIDEKIIDQYYTTVGYFNAIKDLGASSSIISDRVVTTLKYLIEHKFKQVSDEVGLTSKDIIQYVEHDELTSRKTAKEIKTTLSALEVHYPSEYCFNYILASNMLSVGIDINRLGLMTMYSQPKSNAEYIQATSRVGRNKPGIVITMYNAMRSRDKSYYEQFPFYHQTMYQYVEATSITPFSTRTMEKALHCCFTALVRHLVPGMNDNESAVKFRANNKYILEIKQYILDTIASINSEAYEAAEFYLDEYCLLWEKLAKQNYMKFKYKDFQGEEALLQSAENQLDSELPSTLNALRNVEESSNVFLLRRENNG